MRDQQGMEELRKIQPLNIFDGRLLPTLEGKARSMQMDEILQGSDSLNEIVADAAEGQKLLKERLAPEVRWCEIEFRNPDGIDSTPEDHPSRSYKSNPDDFL